MRPPSAERLATSGVKRSLITPVGLPPVRMTHSRRPAPKYSRSGSQWPSAWAGRECSKEDATVESSVLSPGVIVRPGAVVRESVILTDTVIESGAVIERAILDKRVRVEQNAHVGGGIANPVVQLAVVGKNSLIPAGMIVEPGATIGTDVAASDYSGPVVKSGELLETKRQPYEI